MSNSFCACPQPADKANATLAAKALANAAHSNASDPNFRSPWAVEAADAGEGGLFGRLFPRGGKMDDVVVVVALVAEGI